MKKSYISKFNKFGKYTKICLIVFLYILFYYEAFAMMLDMIYAFKKFYDFWPLWILCMTGYSIEVWYVVDYINHSKIEKIWNKKIARALNLVYCLTICCAILFGIFVGAEKFWLYDIMGLGHCSIVITTIAIILIYGIGALDLMVYRILIWLVSLF